MKATDAVHLPPEIQDIRNDILAGALSGVAEANAIARMKGQIPPGMMTLVMLLERCGLTASEGRRLVRNGQLQPVAKNDRGWALYDETSIERLKTRPPRATRMKLTIAQRRGPNAYSEAEGLSVFEEIAKGTSGPQIALNTRIHPAIVAQIMRDWATMGTGVFADGETLQEINEIAKKLYGKVVVKTSRDIVRILHLALRGQTCRCERHPKKYCSYCAKEKFEMDVSDQD